MKYISCARIIGLIILLVCITGCTSTTPWTSQITPPPSTQPVTSAQTVTQLVSQTTPVSTISLPMEKQNITPNTTTPTTVPSATPTLNAGCANGYTATTDGRCILDPTVTQTISGSDQCSVTFGTYNPEVNAEIYIDNVDTGHTTPYILSIQSGVHTYIFKKGGYNDQSSTFTVTAPTAGGICSQAILVPMTSTQSGTTTVTTTSNGGICGSRNEGTFCSGRCVNLKASKDNCGACSNKVKPGNTCVDGQEKATSCLAGQTICNGNCWNLEFAPVATNCGGCGQTCPSGNYCLYGVCQPLTICPPPTHACSAGLCCNEGSDTPNCDSFGKSGYTLCINYVTMTNGPADWCKNLKTDVNNCGSCGKSCPTGSPCTNGNCVNCRSPNSACNGICVNTNTDPTNCGLCGKTCSGTCTNGKCDTRFAIITTGRVLPLAHPWTGTWTMTVTNTGPITMTQSGSTVSGTYTNSYGQTGCSISGSVSGNVLTGSWHEGTGSGPFEFDRAGTLDNFRGWWGLNSPDLTSRKINNPGGNWNGQKQ